MADARLLATNPENSSLVPVACNSQGQIIVSEVKIEGIDNDVTIDGGLTVTGTGNFDASATFAGNVKGSRFFSKTGDIATYLGSTDDYDGTEYSFLVVDESGTPGFNPRALAGIKPNGSASFAGNIMSGDFNIDGSTKGVWIRDSGGIQVSSPAASANALQVVKQNSGETVVIKNNGSAEFAGGKAGFTAEGYLWCTTRRGDTVILDATSNGLGTWADYTPPTRKEQFQAKREEKLEEKREAKLEEKREE